MLSKSIISKLVNINKEDLHQPKSIWSTFKNAYLKRKNLKKFWKKLDKKSLSDDKLLKNFQAVFEILEREKGNNTVKGDLIKNTYLTSTMGVSYKVKPPKNI